MLATVLILASAVLHAVVNVMTKHVPDKLVMRGQLAIGGAVIMTPFAFVVPPPTAEVAVVLALSLPVHLVYTFCLARALETGAFTVVYPIARGTGPLLAALGALAVFGEVPAPLSLLGILLVCGGIFAHGLRANGHGNPLTATLFALATGVAIAGYTVIDAYGVRLVEVALTYIVWLFIIEGFGNGATVLAVRGRARVLQAVRGQWKTGLLATVLSLFGYGFALMALRLGQVAEIAALRETSIAFGAVLGVIFLREHLTRAGWMAIAVLMAGAIVIKIG
jgi:drug/metabolite transporter (DMT)-like permease